MLKLSDSSSDNAYIVEGCNYMSSKRGKKCMCIHTIHTYMNQICAYIYIYIVLYAYRNINIYTYIDYTNDGNHCTKVSKSQKIWHGSCACASEDHPKIHTLVQASSPHNIPCCFQIPCTPKVSNSRIYSSSIRMCMQPNRGNWASLVMRHTLGHSCAALQLRPSLT